jgi:O-antigen ligase
VWERAKQLTAWSGGPVGLGLLIAVQLVLAAIFAVYPPLSVAVVMAAMAIFVVIDQPLLGVGVLLMARLLSTGALVFFRVGRTGIGPLEPTLVLCALALVVHAVISQRKLLHTFPWRNPYVAFFFWVILSMLWSLDRSGGLGEILPMLIVIANTAVILTFVDDWSAFRLMLWVWVGSCVLIGLIAIGVDVLGIQVSSVEFQAASRGGRETGLGQQPNWFAMNLMFIIHTCFGMALLERRQWARIGLALAGFFIFFMMLRSGSRGGAYATLIGGTLAALAHPLFRRWFIRFGALTVLLFAIGIVFNIGDSSQALLRISSNVSINSNIRFLNWQVCLELLVDTWGRGIGVSGYEVVLPTYNNYIAQSLYDYPHGIFWEVSAHYGLIGLLLFGWLVLQVIRMVQDCVVSSKGTQAEVFAWTMPAAMLGYVAWSFVEFTVNEKPFWEFLALYTALYLIVKRAKASGQPLPEWSSPLRLLRKTEEGR